MEQRLDQDVRQFLRSWAGERTEDGYLVDAPDWDTEDIISNMTRLIDQRETELRTLCAFLITAPGERPSDVAKRHHIRGLWGDDEQ